MSRVRWWINGHCSALALAALISGTDPWAIACLVLIALATFPWDEIP